MALDWIPIRCTLFSDPRVIRISVETALPIDSVVGKLVRIWSYANLHSEDGLLRAFNVESFDVMLEKTGFAHAMSVVGWVEIKPDGIQVSQFDKYNSVSAKRRAKEALRQHKRRASPPEKPKPAKKKRTKCVRDAYEMRTDCVRAAYQEQEQEQEIRGNISPKTPFSPTTSEMSPGNPSDIKKDAILLFFPCSGKPDEFPLLVSKVVEWQSTYPAVEVESEIRRAWQWIQDNPSNRKTFRGYPRFLNAWLARCQDRGGSSPSKIAPNAPESTPKASGGLRAAEESLRARIDRIASEMASKKEDHPDE